MAESVQKVAVVPFTIYAEKDLSFLQKGIVDMLTSRLTQEGEVAVLGREETAAALKDFGGPLNPETAAALGKELGADYVLFGSLTVFGESVSVDAKMLDVAGRRPPLPFFAQSTSFGEVIPAIDRFAAQINEEVFGRKPARPAPTAAAGAAAPAPAPRPEAPDTRTHPEKLIEGGFGDASEQMRFGESGLLLTRPWKSRSFDVLINGIDLGDVDGDGRIETVIAVPDKVLIYRYERERFYQTAEIEVPGSRLPVGVDVGDINGNGIPEIFLSALNGSRNGVSSVVFEYAGGKYQPIVESAPFYFRVSDKTGALGQRLYGQRQRIGKDPFAAPIYQMAWENSEYVTGAQALPGNTANVLGFAVGDPLQSGGEQVLAYTRSDNLTVREANGNAIWTSGNKLGGSTLGLTLEAKGRGETERQTYLPMRVRALDLNREPGSEVIAAENLDAAGRRLEQFRAFTKTTFYVFSWDGIGLAPIWKTREIAGHIRDFAVGDFDGDGTDELVAALIVKEGRVAFTEAKSNVIAFDIVLKKGDGKQQN